MIDAFLEWAGDLAAGPSGDLALATGSNAVNQRICRRLLTNGGDYLWQLTYGASLGRFVGTPVNASSIEALVRSQILLETAVPANPPPTIDVRVADQANGIVGATITYADPESPAATPATVTVPVS